MSRNRTAQRTGSRARTTKKKRGSLLGKLLLLCLVLALTGGVFAGGVLLWMSRDLPRFDKLVDYEPKEATRVFASDGRLVATFQDERRTVVPPAEIPEVLKRAILAAEDAEFYQHEGLDYAGIARAFVKNLLSGQTKQGASTITQQVVKTFLLTPERTYERKLKEVILARRIEENLTKDEILYLYLNQIYFGHGRYGVEEAARWYFGKGVKDVTLGEAAMLAGLPQSPARLSPISHPERAKQRQRYVLGRMLENGWISQKEFDAEIDRPIRVAARPPDAPGPYYVEEVRRYLVDRYGNEAVLTGGLQVHVGMDVEVQRAADAALRTGLVAYDRRQGWRGAKVQLDEERRTRAAKRAERVSADMLVDVRDASAVVPKAGVLVAGAVEKVTAAGATLWFGKRTVELPASGLRWTGKKPVDALKKGDVVLTEITKVEGTKIGLQLAQEPEADGALVAIDPKTRRVRALAGGFDFGRSSFDRAMQAKRQPGSAFKPFVFGAALESGRWTAASLVVDAPETFRDPWTGKEWKPRNYDRDAFDGTMTLRSALAKSKNTVAVRLISELGVDPVVEFARRSGIAGSLPENLTLALGTGEVTPMELANAYATIASGGLAGEPVLVEKVVDRNGEVLEEARPQLRPAISPALAYVLGELLQAVVTEGTGKAAAVLGRPTAGKTGTTSDGRDAWFAGFTADLAAVSWVGYDDHRPLGRGETGGRTALPAWIDLMKAAHQGLPPRDFPVPEGVEQVLIDRATGLLAAEGATDEAAVTTAFVAGTAPTEQAVAPGMAPGDVPMELFLGGSEGLVP
ncbi:penicillin-binding protein 1A [Vulgatibacter sp.]|uniref:penicillin-binding protein 1A n=1 Tax=Vulgatibacter sp. TaxID=1971226 RepID=UPI0035692B6B